MLKAAGGIRLAMVALTRSFPSQPQAVMSPFKILSIQALSAPCLAGGRAPRLPALSEKAVQFV